MWEGAVFGCTMWAGWLVLVCSFNGILLMLNVLFDQIVFACWNVSSTFLNDGFICIYFAFTVFNL